MAQFDPAIFQAALLEVAEATKAATNVATQAVQAMQQQQTTVSGSAGSSPQGQSSSSIDWSKLISKPPTFEFSSMEEEIKAFRDWSWQLVQYLTAIDSGFEPELRALLDDPSKALDMQSAGSETRQRSGKLYGLLASLVRNKALSVIRSVSVGDGYEALRQLTLALRPSNNNRGLALLQALTSWPQFQMNQQIQPQLLRLEEVFEEARKAGSEVPDQLKQAVLLKAVTGQLKTHLNLNIEANTKYSDLREQVLRWDRGQQKWSGLIVPDDPYPMDINRMSDEKGKGKKGKGKGKSYDQKGKGKSKGKSKSKDGAKGFSKGKGKDGKGKGGGKYDGSKGKTSGKGDRSCHICGKYGHFARDCWSQNVRSVNLEGQQQQQSQPSGQQTPAGSPMSAGSSGVAQTQQQVSQQNTQYRVSRIQEEHYTDAKHGDVVFDLRSGSPVQSPSGSLRVIRFFIGEEPSENPVSQTCSVRTMTRVKNEDHEMCSILLDSGADASVFPLSISGSGVRSNQGRSNLQDAQGRTIPILDMRDVEIHLVDEHGKHVLLRETVAVSDQISQPILCFGKLLESGWGVNGVEQTLVHNSGISVPIELQNRSMSVRGWIRMLKHELDAEAHDNDDNGDVSKDSSLVRAVKADVFGGLTELRVGWHLNSDGIGTGKHFGDTFQDPSLVMPNMTGEKFRTTLVEVDNQWICLELCERMSDIVDLSAEFFGYIGNRYIITIITESERPPQTMGFSLLVDEDVKETNAPSGSGVEIDIAPIAEDDEIQGIDVDDSAQQQELPYPAGQVIHGQAKDDCILVNGIEVFSHSSFATLRAACEFYNLSKSGSKTKCFQRLWEFQKQMELHAVMGAARDAEAQDQREPKPQRLAKVPDEMEQMKHRLAHLPFQPWCEACTAHRSKQDHHMRSGTSRDSGIATISFDLCYTKAGDQQQQARDLDAVCALVMIDSNTGFMGCVPVSGKGQFAMMVREIINFTQILGHAEVIYRCDNEPTLKQLQSLVVKARQQMGLPTRKTAPVAYSHGNSLCENAIQRIRDLAGSLMHTVQQKLNTVISSEHGLWSWAMRHAAWLLNRFSPSQSVTPFELVYNKTYKGKLCEFAEPVFGFTKTALKGNPKWMRMLFLGKVEGQDSFILYNGSHVMLSRSIRRIDSDWKEYLGFFMHFHAPTWDFKTGYGGRIVPTKTKLEDSELYKTPGRCGSIQAS